MFMYNIICRYVKNNYVLYGKLISNKKNVHSLRKSQEYYTKVTEISKTMSA